MEVNVRDYAGLEKYLDIFKHRDIQVLFVLGEPGQAKSTLVKRAFKDAQLIEARISAFQLYLTLESHRDSIFILDDTDSIFDDKELNRLLKCLCQTETVKRVSWSTANAQLEARNIPKEFDTRTRVIILANKVGQIGKRLASLEDRGLMIHFEPSVDEVLKLAKSFRGKRKIYPKVLDFARSNRRYIAKLSLRSLISTTILKESGLSDWQEVFSKDLGVYRLKLVETLLKDGRFASTVEKAAEFRRQCSENTNPGTSRSTWYELVARLKMLEEDERACQRSAS
jgi:hypothetical protein